MPSTRRPIRIANCAGAACDAGYQMYRQCINGPIDVVTGDFLAEANIATNADNFKAGLHPGYDPNALEGLRLSIPVAKEKGVRIVVNGGSLNPAGLAVVVSGMIRDQHLDLKVGWVSGDDVFPHFEKAMKEGLLHLDGDNAAPFLSKETADFVTDPSGFEVVAANAYVGARGIKRALDLGCDIVICGRVSDASPVIGAAWWWHGWSETQYDQLAGSLVAGHLIECSGYGSGGNFCEFFQVPQEQLLDIGFPIAEIEADGSSIITKHEGTRGLVTANVLKCQLLYEIQGNIYLHSDSKADLSNVVIEDVGENRVGVTGTKGLPPPPTTKVAVFYRAGYQCEYALNATGYATAEKFKLHEAQIRFRLKEEKQLEKFQIIDFQVCGVPVRNPRSQLQSTTTIRVFGQAKERETVEALGRAMLESMLQHYAGMHGTLDWRLLEPKPYIAYCPCLMPQLNLREQVHVLDSAGKVIIEEDTGSPSHFQKMAPRLDYETANPTALSVLGPTAEARLGDVVLARSGDKGANLNIGLFVREADEWEWLRSVLTRGMMRELMADEWKETYKIERCELPGIFAVHFVIYGILGRGVSSSSRLDALGKGFAEFVRDRWVAIPEKFLERYRDSRPSSHAA